jgi:hypothetical protein
MLVDPADNDRLLTALAALTKIVSAMPEKKECRNCLHWKSGCKLAGGQTPPEHVQKAGCGEWEFDGCPF